MPTINESISFPSGENTMSSALAAMMATLTMPEQYARIMADTELSIRQQCNRSVHHIDK